MNPGRFLESYVTESATTTATTTTTSSTSNNNNDSDQGTHPESSCFSRKPLDGWVPDLGERIANKQQRHLMLHLLPIPVHFKVIRSPGSSENTWWTILKMCWLHLVS